MKDKLLLIVGLVLILFGIWTSNQTFPSVERSFKTLVENVGSMIIIIPTESTAENDALLDAYLNSIK
jgi:hypothetical protein